MKKNEWDEIKEMLKAEMDISDYAFLSKDEMANMMGFDGDNMLIVVANSFLKNQLDKPDIVKTIENVVGRYYGKNVTVKIKIGSTTPQLFPKKEEANKKPKMCEILGVEVGDRFRYSTFNKVNKVFFVDATGAIREASSTGIASVEDVLSILNNPDRIIKNKLSEKEQKICELIGAKWVSLDTFGADDVKLWDNEPYNYNGCFMPIEDKTRMVAKTRIEVFPSLNRGDCIYVGE